MERKREEERKRKKRGTSEGREQSRDTRVKREGEKREKRRGGEERRKKRGRGDPVSQQGDKSNIRKHAYTTNSEREETKNKNKKTVEGRAQDQACKVSEIGLSCFLKKIKVEVFTPTVLKRSIYKKSVLFLPFLCTSCFFLFFISSSFSFPVL